VPIWAPDGERLLVVQRGEGLIAMPVRGGKRVRFTDATAQKWATDWSSDGSFIAFEESMPAGWRLWTMNAQTGAPAMYREGPFALHQLQFSPDAKWVAYQSDESGRPEVYVDSYPEPGDRIRVSTAGGGWPRWRQDGRELYYLAPDRKLMAVGVERSPSLVLSAPKALFDGPSVSPDSSRSPYTPDKTGSRFLFAAHLERRTPVGISVIANWPSLLGTR